MRAHRNGRFGLYVPAGAFAGLFAAALAILPHPASALTWQWRFDRKEAPIVEAFGELITSDTADVDGWYTIKGGNRPKQHGANHFIHPNRLTSSRQL